MVTTTPTPGGGFRPLPVTSPFRGGVQRTNKIARFCNQAALSFTLKSAYARFSFSASFIFQGFLMGIHQKFSGVETCQLRQQCLARDKHQTKSTKALGSALFCMTRETHQQFVGVPVAWISPPCLPFKVNPNQNNWNCFTICRLEVYLFTFSCLRSRC